MTIQYCALGSGSRGNSFWIKTEDTQILVDCGLSALCLGRRLKSAGGCVDDIRHIICTHSHRDHIYGICELTRQQQAKSLSVLVWATPKAHEIATRNVTRADKRISPDLVRFLPEGMGCVRIGSMDITVFPVPHDCPGTVSLVIRSGGASLGIATDLGRVPTGLPEALSNLDALIIEMNHDPDMLRTGPYPGHLKKRIRGDFGHLSNAQGAELLKKIIHPGLRHLGLAHISETNNRPELALEAARSVLRQCGSSAEVFACEQNRHGIVRTIGGPRPEPGDGAVKPLF